MKTKELNATYWKPILASVLLFCILYLGYAVKQSDFWRMLPVFALAFGCYLLVLRFPNYFFEGKELQFWILLAVLLRFVLLFGIPNLSDDIYRFIWDGRLMQNGIHPFAHLPSYYIEQEIFPNGITPELFAQLNSPEYYTIYPPIAQASFFIATWLSPNSIWGSAFVMKLIVFAFECGNIYLLLRLLKRFHISQKNAFIYALNPLIILEITGNLHFEGVMIFFLLLSIWMLTKVSSSLVPSSVTETINEKYFFYSAASFAFSIASKLLPLMFLPLLFRKLGWKKSMIYYVIVGIVSLLLFAPLISGVFIQNFGDSLNLYFQKFEFNASFYYIARWIGFQIRGFNLIAKLGPSLALATVVGIGLLSYFYKEKSIQQLPLLMLFSIFIYLSFTTTVHPWYVSLPLVLCCFTRFRFPVLWSCLIFLTYINYSYAVYQENLWIVALEYMLVWAYFLWELSKTKISSFSTA